MKNRTISLIICVVLMLTMLTACAGTSNTAPTKKTIIATTFAAYDWAKNIAKGTDTFDIKYLVDSNVDMHSYSPSADDIIEYMNADLVLCIGGESEEWLEDIQLDDNKVCKLIDAADKKEEVEIEGAQETEEEHEEGEIEYDEHIWLSVKNAERCINEIHSRLTLLDNQNEAAYTKNTEEYMNKLAELDGKYTAVVEQGRLKTLLFGDRFPFRYMADDYGLTYYAAFSGCAAEAEASFETIKFLADKIDELGLHAICTISPDHVLANAIKNNTKLHTQKIVEFNSMQSISNKEADGQSYLDIMQENLYSLRDALE